MDERLKQLYDYTKFHIGVYITLTTGILAVLKFAESDIADVKWWLLATIFLFVAAGAAGGAIASNISAHKLYSDFFRDGLPVFSIKTFRAATWITIEHLAFWLGMASALIGTVKSVIFPDTCIFVIFC